MREIAQSLQSALDGPIECDSYCILVGIVSFNAFGRFQDIPIRDQNGRRRHPAQAADQEEGGALHLDRQHTGFGHHTVVHPRRRVDPGIKIVAGEHDARMSHMHIGCGRALKGQNH